MSFCYQILRCPNPKCELRFPVTEYDLNRDNCPCCGEKTVVVKNFPTKVRTGTPKPKTTGLIIEALLDNIRSVHNVGSIFRTADGAGVKNIHLGGITPTPEHPKFSKAALGAQKTVPWTKHNNGVKAAENLKKESYRLWALENNSVAQSLFSVAKPETVPILLVVGNELGGVDPGILKLCDKILYLPMQGSKGSLNVAVAFGIAVYFLRYGKDGPCQSR